MDFVLSALSGLENEVSTLIIEKTLLELEKRSLQEKRKAIENQLLQSGSQLSETNRRAREAERSLTVSAARLRALNTELQKFFNAKETSNNQFTTLKSLDDEKHIDLVSSKRCEQVQEEELRKLPFAESKEPKEASSFKEFATNMHAEEANFREVAAHLEAEMTTIEDYLENLKNHKRLSVKDIKLLDYKIAALKDNIMLLNSTQEKATTSSIARGNIRTREGLAVIDSTRTNSEGDLNSARSSTSRIEASGEQDCQSMLEYKVARVAKDKHDIAEQAKNAFELEIRKLITSSKEVTKRAEVELSRMKHEVERFDAALIEAKEAAHASEDKFWQLRAELEKINKLLHKKERVTPFALPALAVSTTSLIVVGCMAYMRLATSNFPFCNK